MELGMAMRGYKGEANWSYGASSSISGGYDSHTRAQTITLNAFNVYLSPINIGYKFLLNENMAIDVHVGGFASYDFAGKLKSEYEDHVYSTSKYGNNIKDTNTDSSTSIGDLDGYRKYDFGAIGGIGFWYGHFNIDVSYQRGFISLFEGDNKYFCDKLQLSFTGTGGAHERRQQRHYANNDEDDDEEETIECGLCKGQGEVNLFCSIPINQFVCIAITVTNGLTTC